MTMNLTLEEVKNIENHYIYLVREREFIRMHENIYKLGKTTQIASNQLTSCGKTIEVLLFVKVLDCHKLEPTLMKLFEYNFKQKNDIGLEYFEGNPNDMIKAIMDTILEPRLTIPKSKITEVAEVVQIPIIPTEMPLKSSKKVAEPIEVPDEEKYSQRDLDRIYNFPVENSEGKWEIYSSHNPPSTTINRHVAEKIYNKGLGMIGVLESCLDFYYEYTFSCHDYVSYPEFHKLLELNSPLYKIAHELNLVNMFIYRESGYKFLGTRLHDYENCEYIIRGIKRKDLKPFESINFIQKDSYIAATSRFHASTGKYLGMRGVSKFESDSFRNFSDDNIFRFQLITNLIKTSCIRSPFSQESYGLRGKLEEANTSKKHQKYWNDIGCISEMEVILCALVLKVDYKLREDESSTINLFLEMKNIK